MNDWNKELEIYSMEEILEFNDVSPAEALIMLEDTGLSLKVPAVPVDVES